MASPRFKGALKKKLNTQLELSSLRKENTYLKKTLFELSRQQSEHNKLLERFLSLETVRLESCQQQAVKDEKVALPSEPLSKKEDKPMDEVSTGGKRSISSHCREIEDIKNKLVTVSSRCQYLENRVTRKKDSTSDERTSSNSGINLQNELKDALEKNKQWLEYDQQREAYVGAILARMLWLEKQLNEANQARSQQHNEDHSDEKERMIQMQEYYERLLQKAKDELEVLREQVNRTQQNLIMTQNWCKEREDEVEELKQQLRTEKISQKSTPEDYHCSEDEAQELQDETKDLQHKLDEERRRSASFELQANLCQKFLVNQHHADQGKIADLERQIKNSSQDLEDERQDCLYLKRLMIRVLKKLQRDHVTKQSKRLQQDRSSCEAASFTSSPHSSLRSESFLECPGCRAEYPACHHRELLNHMDLCLE